MVCSILFLTPDEKLFIGKALGFWVTTRPRRHFHRKKTPVQMWHGKTSFSQRFPSPVFYYSRDEWVLLTDFLSTSFPFVEFVFASVLKLCHVQTMPHHNQAVFQRINFYLVSRTRIPTSVVLPYLLIFQFKLQTFTF